MKVSTDQKRLNAALHLIKPGTHKSYGAASNVRIDAKDTERERVTGIEPAFSAWESERPDFSGPARKEYAGQRGDGRFWTWADGSGCAMKAP